MADDQPDAAATATVLASVVPGPVTVDRIRALPGGASAQTWALDVTDGSGAAHALVLRRGAGRGGISLGLDARLEPLVQRVAVGCGVPAAPVLAVFADHPVLGTGYVMQRLAGESIPRRLLRDETYGDARAALVADCAAALARIHAVPTDLLPPLPGGPAGEQVDGLESLHRSVGQRVPTFEAGFRWLRENLPEPVAPRLVHGDFRMGNFLVDRAGLVAVLDWELAHTGDPMEDVGWLCTRAWRFGGPGEVGGFGAREELYAAYGTGIDGDRVRFWEVFGALKWGVICQLQAFAHLGGAARSVERAAIGRRVTEAELDLLLLIA